MYPFRIRTDSAAGAALRRLIKENPQYGDAYMFLGSCYIATQETEKGEQQYKIFLKRWPKHPDAQMVRDSLGQ